MANMIPISTITVGSGGVSTIDFINIPQTYTDLVVKISARKTSTGGSNLQMQFNGSTSGYAQKVLLGNGSTVASYNDTSEIGFMYVTISSDTSNTFSSTDIHIPNYTGSNQKALSIDNVVENNATAANAATTTAVWTSTAPINRIYFQIANGGGVFAQYSTATLYGIRKY
jgi:hypothetical protein